MNVFLTGGAGFLGRRVVRRLLASGHRVRCLVRSQSSEGIDVLRRLPGAAQNLDFAYGSLQDHPDLPRAIAGYDRIIHIAAAVKGAAPTLFLDTVVGTRALVAASL